MDVKQHLVVSPEGDSIVAANNWPIACTVQLTVTGQQMTLADGRNLRSLHIIPPYAAGARCFS